MLEITARDFSGNQKTLNIIYFSLNLIKEYIYFFDYLNIENISSITNKYIYFLLFFFGRFY